MATVRICAKRGAIERPATAILVRQESNFFLVTALHVLTCRNWETKKPSCNGFLPESYVVALPFHKSTPDTQSFSWFKFWLKPTSDKDEMASWLVHPEHGENVDVAVISLGNSPEVTLNEKISQGFAGSGSFIFAYDWLTPIKLQAHVSDDLFVVGFPENIKVTGDFPIWKRGSIATEPDIPIQNLPYILADTGTRSGMSGSPVLHRGDRLQTNHPQIVSRLPQPTTEFFGIYSGRFGADELTSQLGIVWHRKVISEIIHGNRFGKSTLCSWLW